MKKYNLIILFAVLFFAACEPNKDIYDNLDALPLGSQPYKIGTYTFGAADYTVASKAALKVSVTASDIAFAKAIGTAKAFNQRFPVDTFFAKVLTGRYPSATPNSLVNATYNVDLGAFFGTIYYKPMFNSDYTAIGGAVATAGYFTSTTLASSLPGYLKVLYPTAATNDCVQINYKYQSTTVTVSDFWRFDGTVWAPMPNSFVFLTADYASIGGLIAARNQFNADTPPQNYLPQFLKLKYPYAQSGETHNVVYKTGNATGDPIPAASRYDFNGTNWVLYNQITTKSTQYKLAESGWIVDPTVYYTMAKADYATIVSFVNATDSIKNYYDASQTTPKEWYFGCDPYYPEFNMTLSLRKTHDPNGTLTGKTDAQIMTVLNQRVQSALLYLLQTKYPAATPTLNGVQMYYVITYKIYTGAINALYTAKFKCTDIGKFEIDTYVPVQ